MAETAQPEFRRLIDTSRWAAIASGSSRPTSAGGHREMIAAKRPFAIRMSLILRSLNDLN
jgi:hypothetical protein